MTGAAGYLGSEICAHAEARGIDVVAATRGTFDVRDDAAVERTFLRVGPDAVIHTAYVMHDRETIVRGTRNVAEAAHRVGARLVHVSTDLVFDGEHGAPYDEDDEPRPLLEYGAAKLEAERLAGDALVVRTSLLYGKPGPQEALALRDDVVFHTDEIRCPTRVDELAATLLDLACLDVTGPLHVAGPDAVSRHELARLLRGTDVPGAPAPPGRPRNVALDSRKAAEILGRTLTGVRAAIGRSA